MQDSVCQETGFRLIRRCVTKYQTSNVLVEDKYINEACSLYTEGTLEDYNADPKNLLGHQAEPGSEPYSMLKFMMIMLLLGSVMVYVLNHRK